jgi:hypothetical protein
MRHRQIDQQPDHGVYDNEWSDNAGPWGDVLPNDFSVEQCQDMLIDLDQSG